MDDMALLREYATRNSEAAFEELVSRRIGLVHSAALRQLRDPHLAQEVTQAVFLLLAQKAGRISDQTLLTGWLFKTTRFVALAQIRSAAKRRQREQEMQMQADPQEGARDPVWDLVSPLLDEALVELSEKDRQAVLLHFFEKKSFAHVGGVLGTSEEGARKRTGRALEKLRRFLGRRGVRSTTSVLGGVLFANSIQAVPVVLVKSVTAAALAHGTAATGSVLILIKGALTIMAWTKAKTAIVVGVGVLLAAGTATVVTSAVAKRNATPTNATDRFPAGSRTTLEVTGTAGAAFTVEYLRGSERVTTSGVVPWKLTDTNMFRLEIRKERTADTLVCTATRTGSWPFFIEAHSNPGTTGLRFNMDRGPNFETIR